MLSCNAGLKLRVPGRIQIDSFTAGETCVLLKKRLVEKGLLPLDSEADDELARAAEQAVLSAGWANGRAVGTWEDAIFRRVATDRATSVLPAQIRETAALMLASAADTERSRGEEGCASARPPPPAAVSAGAPTAHEARVQSTTTAAAAQELRAEHISKKPRFEEVEEEAVAHAYAQDDGADDEIRAALQAAAVKLGYDTRGGWSPRKSAAESVQGSAFPSTSPGRCARSARPPTRGSTGRCARRCPRCCEASARPSSTRSSSARSLRGRTRPSASA